MRPSLEIYSWNPRQPLFPGRIGARIRLGPRINNFGDLIGPMVVSAMLRHRCLDRALPVRQTQLLTVGSVLHLAKVGAVVWGTGINGKILPSPEVLHSLDVRAVRGPLTRKYLLDHGVETPPVYGDPALLLPFLMPRLAQVEKSRRRLVVPNLNDVEEYAEYDYLDPRTPLMTCLRAIVSSSLVVGSSLHAIIVAEAFGVPARLVESAAEPAFKYEDYYAGTGRDFVPATSVAHALALGGAPAPQWDPTPLFKTFPVDLWQG